MTLPQLAALMLLCARLAAAQEESPKRPLWTDGKPPTREQLQEHEFSSWYLETAQRAGLVPEIISLLVEPRLPENLRLFNLAHQISRLDPALRRYLTRVEDLFEKNKRLNPYDLKLLSSLRTFADEKRELTDRLAKLCSRAGVPEKKPGGEWKDSLTLTPPKPQPGDLRYDVDTGLWEKFDGKKKSWEPYDLRAP